MKVVLLVRSLERGGAETQLVALARGLLERGNRVSVVCFYGDGPLGKELESGHVPYWAAGKGGRWDMVGFAARTIRKLRELKPDVVYASMPAANVLASLFSGFIGRPKIAWRLASSNMELSGYDWLSRLTYRAESMLRHLPDAIVANAQAGREAALRRGYPEGKLSVITNGIDTDRFRRQPEKGAGVRSAWNLGSAQWVIGQAARADPKKDYPTFIDAAGILCRERDDVCFLCVGLNPGKHTEYLKTRAREKGIGERIVWRGIQSDMAPVYSAMDINTLSSAFGEGFPNTVAEAMACGTPCVVTDVGDSALIVGRTGRVVAPGSPESLARAWSSLIEALEREGQTLRDEARKRIEADFSMSTYIEKTERFLLSLD